MLNTDHDTQTPRKSPVDSKSVVIKLSLKGVLNERKNNVKNKLFFDQFNDLWVREKVDGKRLLFFTGEGQAINLWHLAIRDAIEYSQNLIPPNSTFLNGHIVLRHVLDCVTKDIESEKLFSCEHFNNAKEIKCWNAQQAVGRSEKGTYEAYLLCMAESFSDTIIVLFLYKAAHGQYFPIRSRLIHIPIDSTSSHSFFSAGCERGSRCVPINSCDVTKEILLKAINSKDEQNKMQLLMNVKKMLCGLKADRTVCCPEGE